MTEQQYTSVKSQIHTTGCRMLNFILNFFWKSEKMKDSSVQLFSCVRLFATPWTAACQAYLSILPGTCSNSCPLNRWCHPAISSSVTLFSSCLQSFPASGSFQMSQLFTSGGQSIGASASASALPMNIQDWFPLGWLVGSPCSPRDSQESSPTPQLCVSLSVVSDSLRPHGR